MKFLRTLALCLLVTGLGAGSAAFAADNPAAGEKKPPPKDLILKGDAKCTGCHDEADDAPPTMLELNPSVLAIGKTKHGTTADSRTPTCTDCHGESEKHRAHKGKGKPPSPDRSYRKKTQTPVVERNDACLTCHQGGNRMNWHVSAHGTQDVACTTCHNVHAQRDKVREKAAQSEICYSCHKEQRAQMNRPSHHPVPEGKMGCSDCHNAHGSAGPKMLVKDSINDTCYECHMEKRGPFLHNHQPVTENCAICHNPHGTTAPTLLKQRQPLMCQNCHNVNGGGEHRVAFVQQRSGRSITKQDIGSMARGCLNCHTNIHGSNSTTKSDTGGRFRQ